MKKQIIISAIAFGVLSGFAQDKALLETLVAKGYLSNQEAAQVARENVVVSPGSSETKSIKLVGGVSGWYSWSSVNVKDSGAQHENNSFTMRYVKLGVEADVGGGWDINLMTDFGAEGEDRNYIDNITISKNFDLGYTAGTVDFGFRKVNFGLEQSYDDFEQFAIERSVTTWFFTRPSVTSNGVRTNFGSRATGVFWNANVDSIKGIYYGFSLTGGATEDVSLNNNNNDLNKLSVFLNAGYKKEILSESDSFGYDLGLNYGYASGGAMPLSDSVSGTIWGVNPYFKVRWQNLTLIGEYFLQSIENAREDNQDAMAQGANLTLAWKENIGQWGAIEPIFRYSYLNTNGAGFSSNYGIDYFDKDGNVNTAITFDVANSFYFGANWYVVPAVKLSLGYEFALYEKLLNSSSSSNATDNSIKAQLQVIF